MGDTKPFCDLCEMLPNGRHGFGCPADDGVPSAAPAPDTMREAAPSIHEKINRRSAEALLAECLEAYRRAGYEAGLEDGRQLGMEQARRKPLSDEQRRQMWRDTDFRGNGGQIDWFMEGTRAAEQYHGIPTPPAGDSDTQS